MATRNKGERSKDDATTITVDLPPDILIRLDMAIQHQGKTGARPTRSDIILQALESVLPESPTMVAAQVQARKKAFDERAAKEMGRDEGVRVENLNAQNDG